MWIWIQILKPKKQGKLVAQQRINKCTIVNNNETLSSKNVKIKQDYEWEQCGMSFIYCKILGPNKEGHIVFLLMSSFWVPMPMSV